MKLTSETESRIIEMAWEDRTPFEAIEFQFGLNESDVIQFMRSRLNQVALNCGVKGFRGAIQNTNKLRNSDIIRGYCPTQYKPR
ncbi:hypothetical protein K04M3_13940 [Vibrio alginolyticus]|nr:hypothetical protein K04M3_13940 [Vibrio alginolyticus]